MGTVNAMLSADTAVECSPRSVKDTAQKPNVNGIPTDSALFDVRINGQDAGVSHIAVTMQNLGSLSSFKMIKFNAKPKKSSLTVFFSFAAAKAEQSGKKGGSSALGGGQWFAGRNRSIDEKDNRMVFTKQVIQAVLDELKVSGQIDETLLREDQKDRMLSKVHDALNQFQNIAYTQGLKAGNDSSR